MFSKIFLYLKKIRTNYRSLILIFLIPRVVSAVDLMDIYQQALDDDPIFKQAYSTYLSNQEAIPQARAALYPQLTLAALAGRNTMTVNAAGTFPIHTTYNASQWEVHASQAIFNYKAWAALRRAKASVKSAAATFNSAAQDLILRTARAYFQILLAKDTLKFAEAKKRANKRQLEQAEQRFQVGLDPITSVYEARAAYDQSTALVIQSKNNQVNQNENLRKLTNHVYDFLAPLKNNSIPLIKPEPNNVEEWVYTSLKQNFSLFAAKFNLEMAKEKIKNITAGNWPIFSIEANSVGTQNNPRNSSFFIPSQQISSDLGISMTFPLIQGGLVESQTRQAQYDLQTSNQQYEQAYRNVIVNSRIAFNTIIDGISKVEADKQTIISQQNSLDSTEAQFEVGTRTMVDVVNAQQRLFEAQQQLANDQYNLINAILDLKNLAGTLNVDDLTEINSWLSTVKISGLEHSKAKIKS